MKFISSVAGQERNMNTSWGLIVVLLSFAFVFLQQASAQTCKVTQENDQTIYSIPHVDASQCQHSWANTTGTIHTVLAHHKGRNDELVRSNNISTLITSRCFDWIVYKRNCISEVASYTANCTTICKAKVSSLRNIATYRSHIAVIIPAVVAAVLLLAVFLIYKYRKPLREN